MKIKENNHHLLLLIDDTERKIINFSLQIIKYDDECSPVAGCENNEIDRLIELFSSNINEIIINLNELKIIYSCLHYCVNGIGLENTINYDIYYDDDILREIIWNNIIKEVNNYL